jgi:hypothetical protein
MLDENVVKLAKPKPRPYKLADGMGLHLLVNPSGSRLWRLKYRFGNKETCLSFGAYPEVSLAEARKQRDLARAQLRAGIDPMEARRAERARQRTRREARDFRLSLSAADELTVSTRYQSFRLTALHTRALRAFLFAANESQGVPHAAQ